METTLRLYWRDPRLQVEHLLGNKTGDDYVLLHPDASNFIWFPDIYIGEWLIELVLMSSEVVRGRTEVSLTVVSAF